MKKTENHLDLLSKRLALVDKISIADGVAMLGVTESSVRRIFARMEREGHALRVHGGIVRMVPRQKTKSYDYNIVQAVNLLQKKRIAVAAAKILAEKGSVYLDSGSTLYQVSIALADLIGRHGVSSSLQVFTNSLKNLEVLQGVCSIRISGGDYRVERQDLCGFIAENAISILNFDACVLGADGVDIDGGLTTTDFETADLCMRALKQSKIKILVVDSSKFHKTALVTYGRISDVSILITDSGITKETLAMLKTQGITVLVV